MNYDILVKKIDALEYQYAAYRFSVQQLILTDNAYSNRYNRLIETMANIDRVIDVYHELRKAYD